MKQMQEIRCRYCGLIRETFCPECGAGVACDEDGLCVTCGATVGGAAVARLARDVRWMLDEITRLQEAASMRDGVRDDD